jgi:hypothetical protein
MKESAMKECLTFHELHKAIVAVRSTYVGYWTNINYYQLQTKYIRMHLEGETPRNFSSAFYIIPELTYLIV